MEGDDPRVSDPDRGSERRALDRLRGTVSTWETGPPTVGPLRGAADGTRSASHDRHDRLFESMTGLADETLGRLAAEIGLDVQRFVADLAAHRYKDRIR